MKKLALLLPMASLLALAACETTEGPPPPMRHAPAHRPPAPGAAARYDEADFTWSSQGGENAVTGRVAYRSKAAGGYSCAGGSVALTPEAPFSAARTMRLYGSVQHAVTSPETVRARSAEDGAPPYASFVRSATCDAEGVFRFTDLPDGGWFLITRASPKKGEPLVFMQRIETRGGRSIKVELY